jgi:hypothetical protein
MNAGGMVRLQDGGTANFTRLTLTNLNRANQGVLTVFDGNGRLGTSELLTSTNIFGVAAASAVTNGILAPSIVEVDSDNAAKFVTVSSGSLVAYSGATVASLAGLQPTAIADLAGAQTLAGVNSVYALRTASNLSGGTLRVQSVSNANMGAHGVEQPDLWRCHPDLHRRQRGLRRGARLCLRRHGHAEW